MNKAQIDLPIFWAHYPSLRNQLVKQEVFNPRNDAIRFTWDDLFEMRMFSSYIYKESNVFDRRIQDYATGVDALRESDRIKQDIFNFEHDLWSY
jgi:gliding motility associated protien GldN